MHLQKGKILLSVVALSLLGGCSTTSSVEPPAELSRPNSEALQELVNISIEARDELRLLAKTQEAMAQKQMTKEQHEARFIEATRVPEGFDKVVTFKYTGKASKAAKAISMIAGYKYAPPTGVIPANEPWVHIDIDKQPLNDALRELGVQTGDTVRVELHAKVMRLIYK